MRGPFGSRRLSDEDDRQQGGNHKPVRIEKALHGPRRLRRAGRQGKGSDCHALRGSKAREIRPIANPLRRIAVGPGRGSPRRHGDTQRVLLLLRSPSSTRLPFFLMIHAHTNIESLSVLRGEFSLSSSGSTSPPSTSTS